jgi:hypothetical protein
MLDQLDQELALIDRALQLFACRQPRHEAQDQWDVVFS